MRVFVYYNLHKKCWSVKALEGENKGRVIAHSHHVGLRDVTGKVSAAGRERVRRERKKYVHAGIVGELLVLDEPQSVGDLHPWKEVTYNPYKHDTFVYRKDHETFDQAGFAYLDASQAPKVLVSR